MNIKAIEEILKLEIPYQSKESEIIRILAADKNVVPIILRILDAERDESHELLTDINVELSRSLVAIEDKNIGIKGKQIIERDFVIGEIKKFYLKWQHKIHCCFKIKGLP